MGLQIGSLTAKASMYLSPRNRGTIPFSVKEPEVDTVWEPREIQQAQWKPKTVGHLSSRNSWFGFNRKLWQHDILIQHFFLLVYMQINYVLNYPLFASFISCIFLWSSKSNFSKWLSQKPNVEGNVKIKIQTNLQIKEAANPMRTAPWGKWWGHAKFKMKVATDLPRVHFLNTSCRKSLFLQYTQDYLSNMALPL